ncbi:MFS transporter [Bradyrhizobium cenepequi]|uniref:MFS transporter n=1 Tax=Bradyrhizobium cenepequi TaxID=2821403 RepID=UPI001CE38D25|nr:MFS transporter [Bradyrhizobium cenepequi]MCA6106185.1 MFS transporter [Bradyrhizobium cenepequi]
MSLLIGSGIIASAQIGKAVISIPLIRNDLALGVDLAGLIVATFATLGAITGIGAGVVVGRFGLRRSLITGMSAMALGNVIGAGAPNELVLLAARIIEGVGFLAVVLAIPSVFAQLVPREKRDFVMAAWSAYMPIGIMLMLLAAPLLPTIGWRSFWLVNALATGACTILLAIHAPAMPPTARAEAARFFADALAIVRQPSCLLLAFAFFAYSCQYFSLVFALPLLLTSVHGVPLGAAGLLTAFVLAVSAIGHLSSSLLLRVGVPIWANVAAAFGFFALSCIAVYGGVLPPQGISIVAALALGVGGLAPGAIYAAAPHAAPAPSAVPPAIGLVQQASSLGQFAGPASLGLLVAHLGWQAAPAILAPVALLGLACAFALRRILASAEPRDRSERQGAARQWRPGDQVHRMREIR